MKQDKQIILFDGICNLCNGFVQWVIKRDTSDTFRFAAIQSDIGMQLIKERNLDTETMDSIILIQPDTGYATKSTAALKIGTSFGGIYRALVLLGIIPVLIRDRIYDWVARNRYKWYGKREQCMIPTPEIKAKFLEEVNSDSTE